MDQRHASLADSIEIELIRSVYDAFVPSAIMSICFAVAGAIICWQMSDPLLLVIVVGGILASAIRLAEA